MERLQGRVVLVSGGTTGIGEAIVRRFVAEGATVEFCGRSVGGGDPLVAELGPQSGFRACDVGDPGSVTAWVDDVAERRGRLDIVVTCAAVAPAGPLEEMAVEAWDELMRVNLSGSFFVCKAAIPHLRANGGGSIVTMGSTASYIGLPGAVAYGVTKAAALSLAKGLALELADANIRVNALCPGATLTPAAETWFASMPDPEAVRAGLEAGHALNRLSTPAEQAAAAAFLVSDEASFVTGIGFLADGGYTAR